MPRVLKTENKWKTGASQVILAPRERIEKKPVQNANCTTREKGRCSTSEGTLPFGSNSEIPAVHVLSRGRAMEMIGYPPVIRSR